MGCVPLWGPCGEGRGVRGLTEVRARSTTCSGVSLLWPGVPEKREVVGDDGRRLGERDGLPGRTGPAPWGLGGEKELKAKLMRPPTPPAPSLPEELELMEALLP